MSGVGVKWLKRKVWRVERKLYWGNLVGLWWQLEFEFGGKQRGVSRKRPWVWGRQGSQKEPRCRESSFRSRSFRTPQVWEWGALQCDCIDSDSEVVGVSTELGAVGTAEMVPGSHHVLGHKDFQT